MATYSLNHWSTTCSLSCCRASLNSEDKISKRFIVRRPIPLRVEHGTRRGSAPSGGCRSFLESYFKEGFRRERAMAQRHCHCLLSSTSHLLMNLLDKGNGIRICSQVRAEVDVSIAWLLTLWTLDEWNRHSFWFSPSLAPRPNAWADINVQMEHKVKHLNGQVSRLLWHFSWLLGPLEILFGFTPFCALARQYEWNSDLESDNRRNHYFPNSFLIAHG